MSGDKKEHGFFMKNRLFCVVLLLLLCLLTSCSQSAEDNTREIDPRLVDAKISLQRNPCLGTCPYYTVTVSGDGTVIYEGTAHVKTVGTITYTIPVEDIITFVDEVERMGFFSLEDSYAVQAFDLPGALTSITISEKSKEVYRYGIGCGSQRPELGNAPEELCNIEALIDQLARTRDLVTGEE